MDIQDQPWIIGGDFNMITSLHEKEEELGGWRQKVRPSNKL
jgi:hypothetical protein